jgi:long-chain acyl-CoA synthetase
MNISELGENEVNQYGEHVVLIYEDKEITNVQMGKCAKKLGNALKKLGVKRGDRVIIQMPNCPEVLQCFQAVWRIGAVVVPINFLVGEEETTYIYEDSGAKVIISSLDFLPKVEAGRLKVSAIEHVILINKEVPPNCLSYWKLVNENSDELEIEKTEDNDLAALIYTAGTTGRPKGVMHTHLSLHYNAKMQKESLESMNFPLGLTSVSILPLCHSYGIATMNSGSLLGAGKGKTILLNTFDVEKIFEAIDKYKANVLAAVPTMYVYMLLYPNPKKYDFSSMKYWVCGSAPLSLETWKNFKEKFGFEIIEGWGLTEAGANNSVNPFSGLKKVGSIGKPMKGTDIRIVDDDDNEVPQGTEGEIVIRGPMIMKGYWNKPEETARILKDGWLHTGDVGYVDSDGYFFITDRKKDLIIKGGENISPREVEEVIFSHPKVSEAAAIGIKDEVYGEDIKAFVVLKPGQTATENEIIEYCVERLKRFKSPKTVQFMTALPKSLVGKVLKRELRKLG